MQAVQHDPFILFQKQAYRNGWLKSIIIGFSAAMAAVGAILLMSKLLSFSAVFCLFGLVALPLGCAISLIFHRTSDSMLAKRLDKTFELHEKTQTMVEFAKSDGIIANIQREDARERLSEIPVRRMGFPHRTLYIVMPILCAALLITALVFPVSADLPDEDKVPEEPPRDITEWEWKALDELIETVRASAADETIMKPKTLDALENLRSRLQRGVTEIGLPLAVQTAVTAINNAEVEANEQEKLSDEQKEINTAVSQETIAALYSIFDIQSNDDSNIDDSSKDDDTENNGSSSAGSDSTDAASNDRIFDPQEGSVLYKNVIHNYMNEMEQAFSEGVLSREEWYDYIIAYFNALNRPHSNQDITEG